LKIAQRFTRPISAGLTDALGLLRMGPFSPSMFHAVVNSDADVIGGTAAPYFHMFYPGLAARLGKRIPFVCYGALHLHGSHVSEPVLRMIRNADAYAAHTTFERDFLIRHHVPPENIHIVGAGVDLARFEKGNGRIIRDRYGLSDAPLVAFIGRQAAYKGVDTLIHAMRAVWQQVPAAQLLIAGARTAFSSNLNTLISTLSPAEQARTLVLNEFTDEDKADVMSACDVFVMLSGGESFGIVYLEAWACGKPVLAGRIGAVQSIVSDGHDGFTIEIGNVRELAAAIVRLLENEELRVRMGANGRAKVQAHYTWDIVTAKLRAVYEKVRR
jgi:glycosyltransferase involved in cell wall biosynthesis